MESVNVCFELNTWILDVVWFTYFYKMKDEI